MVVTQSMKAYCTYCSAQKDPSQKMLPAIKRYKSQRIRSVYEESQKEKHKFIIFSGKFGLLYPNDEVPFYDHLLRISEVEEHAKKIADQIDEMGFNQIVFFVRSPLEDKNVLNYIECLSLACDKTHTRLEIHEYSGF